jgi:hypothetical protein
MGWCCRLAAQAAAVSGSLLATGRERLLLLVLLPVLLADSHSKSA